jgi:hypothetical protein
METLTAERVREKNAADSLRIVTYLGAAAFVIAAAWFWLATKGVTVATAPQIGPNVTPEQGMHANPIQTTNSIAFTPDPG